jgi:hypothetical protein
MLHRNTFIAEIRKQTTLCTIIGVWVCNYIFRSLSSISLDVLLVSIAESENVGSCEYLNLYLCSDLSNQFRLCRESDVGSLAVSITPGSLCCLYNFVLPSALKQYESFCRGWGPDMLSFHGVHCGSVAGYLQFSYVKICIKAKKIFSFLRGNYLN